MHLEDLFVRPPFRGRGVGKGLLIELARIAVAKGCGRLNWNVLDWNTPALQFYEKLGARALREWEIMRLDGEALGRLAREGVDSAP
jgi:GNAT superfamily N-acetyltransferase